MKKETVQQITNRIAKCAAQNQIEVSIVHLGETYTVVSFSDFPIFSLHVTLDTNRNPQIFLTNEGKIATTAKPATYANIGLFVGLATAKQIDFKPDFPTGNRQPKPSSGNQEGGSPEVGRLPEGGSPEVAQLIVAIEDMLQNDGSPEEGSPEGWQPEEGYFSNMIGRLFGGSPEVGGSNLNRHLMENGGLPEFGECNDFDGSVMAIVDTLTVAGWVPVATGGGEINIDTGLEYMEFVFGLPSGFEVEVLIEEEKFGFIRLTGCATNRGRAFCTVEGLRFATVETATLLIFQMANPPQEEGGSDNGGLPEVGNDPILDETDDLNLDWDIE